jgi:hypothetical protein
MVEKQHFQPKERHFDWERRYEHDAWRVTTPEMSHRFSVGLAEGGLLPQYVDNCVPGPVFWWDRHLTPAEHGICEQALTLALGELPSDAS